LASRGYCEQCNSDGSTMLCLTVAMEGGRLTAAYIGGGGGLLLDNGSSAYDFNFFYITSLCFTFLFNGQRRLTAQRRTSKSLCG